MARTSNRAPEVALPASAFTGIRDALVEVVGPEAAAEALRAAGYAAGDVLHDVLAGQADDLAGLPADRFWSRLSQLFSSRGWGTLEYSEAHPGVGSLTAPRWAEARDDAASDQPTCHFTTGLLANLLGRVAGKDVAVLEVECRSRGDDACRFLFGGTPAVYAVYERMAAGDDAEAALARIG